MKSIQPEFDFNLSRLNSRDNVQYVGYRLEDSSVQVWATALEFSYAVGCREARWPNGRCAGLLIELFRFEPKDSASLHLGAEHKCVPRI